MSNIRVVTKDVLVYAPAKIIPGLIGFLAVIIYARLLRPDDFGHYILAITSISLVSSTAFGWIASAAVRFWEEDRKKGDLSQLLSNLFFASVVLYGIVILVGCAVLRFWGGARKFDPPLFAVGLAALGATVFYTLVTSINRAERKTIKFALYSNLYAAVTVVVAVLAMRLLHTGAEGPLWGMLIAGGCIVLIELCILIPTVGVKLSLVSWKNIIEYASYGFPLIGVGFGTMVLSDGDRYLVAYFRNAAEAGIYGAVYNIANNSIGVIIIVLSAATLPVLIQIYEREGEQKAMATLSYTVSLYLLVLVPAATGFSVLSRNTLGVVFPLEFMRGAGVVPWVAAGVLFYGAANMVLIPFTLKKRTGPIFVFILTSAIVNVLVDLVLIPKMGMIGAGVGTTCAYALYFLLVLYFSEKLMPMALPWTCLWKSVLSAGIMGTLLSLWRPDSQGISWLVGKIVVGMLVYVLCLWGLREEIVIRILGMAPSILVPARKEI